MYLMEYHSTPKAPQLFLALVELIASVPFIFANIRARLDDVDSAAAETIKQKSYYFCL